LIGHLGFLNQVSNQISLQVAHFDPESLAHFNLDLVAHFNPEYPHFNPLYKEKYPGGEKVRQGGPEGARREYIGSSFTHYSFTN
jgi:hypothetical protein